MPETKRPVGEIVAGADGKMCRYVDANEQLAASLGVEAEFAIEPVEGEGRCLVLYLSEGQGDQTADTNIIVDGRVARTTDKGVIFEEGVMAADFHPNNETGQFPIPPVYARNARVIPIEAGLLEGDSTTASNEIRADRIETEDGTLTQLHVFSGASRIVIYNINTSEQKHSFVMVAGEQIRFDDEGNLISMYSFNNNEHIIESFRGEEGTSCSVASSPLSGARHNEHYTPGDLILPIVIVLSSRMTRSAIGKCLARLRPALALLGYGAAQVGQIVSQVNEKLKALIPEDSGNKASKSDENVLK